MVIQRNHIPNAQNVLYVAIKKVYIAFTKLTFETECVSIFGTQSSPSEFWLILVMNVGNECGYLFIDLFFREVL